MKVSEFTDSFHLDWDPLGGGAQGDRDPFVMLHLAGSEGKRTLFRRKASLKELKVSCGEGGGEVQRRACVCMCILFIYVYIFF